MTYEQSVRAHSFAEVLCGMIEGVPASPSGHSPSGLSQSPLSQAKPNVPNARERGK